MAYQNEKNAEKLLKISEKFYDLIVRLKQENFDFCAYVVEEAYRFYMNELEKVLSGKQIN